MSVRHLPSALSPTTPEPPIETTLLAQTASAYDAYRDFGTARLDVTDIQARLLEARADALYDALGLEALLAKARETGHLNQAVVTALETAVDDAHEHTVLLADAIRATAP
ncbi:hypothetical protein [Streptacidiphilus anmyonensis]|uniref:hypothetical protein n=1 Tax=Streptacidiphilus anmyonensis TaxID=405782 RepID=UPI0005A6E6DC|nr:hypothetical protein [Streptacidiphilus anmyonensis]